MKEIPAQCDYYTCDERGDKPRYYLSVGEGRYKKCRYYELHKSILEELAEPQSI